MTAPASDRDWDLTAPESLVLRDGPRADRTLAVKVGLLELVTRRSLRLVDIPGRNWLGRPTVEKVLARGTEPLPRDGALAPIATAFLLARETRYPDGTHGRSVKDLARAFATGKRTRGGRYVSDIVLPELGARGLYSRQQDRLLGLFPRTRWFLTSEGDRRRAQLFDVLAAGERELGEASGRDPRQVAATLATAGAATLLLTSAYPELSELSRRLRQDLPAGDGGWIAATTVTGTDAPDAAPTPDSPFDPSPSPTPELDPGALDSFDVGAFGDLDLSAFDGIDSAFDAIDSGINAGGGDGGGDGGGGDGGGGGD